LINGSRDHPAGRIKGFDGLRAIAFLLVFVSHKAAFPLTERLGTTGVWLFFVLSGFLIVRILARHRCELEQGEGFFSDHLLNFYKRRTLRIFPVYYAFLAVVSLLAFGGFFDLGTKGRQISNFFFFANVYTEYRGWGLLGHLWSLAVEEQFYLLFAPLALAVPRKQLPALCLAMIAVSIGSHFLLLARDSSNVSFDVNSFTNFGLLGLGGVAGLAAERPLPKWASSDVAIVLALSVFLIVPLFVETRSYLSYGRLGGVFVAILLVQITQNQDGRAVSLLNVGSLREIGLISYAAYLFHPVIHAQGLFSQLGVSPPHWTVMGVELAITVGLAMLSRRLLEIPARKLFGSRPSDRAQPRGAFASD
jgi:peptidoglycan/LPS O-acetylase OafA/YrhL